MHWGETLVTPLGHLWGQHWVNLRGNLGVSLGSNLESNLTGYCWGSFGENLGAALRETVGGALGALYRVKKMAIFEINKHSYSR